MVVLRRRSSHRGLSEAWRSGGGVGQARGVALAALILGYQLLALLERAPSLRRPRDLLPGSLRSWVVWVASAASLPLLMYVPATAGLMKVVPLPPRDWAMALATAGLALGWRIAVASRQKAAP